MFLISVNISLYFTAGETFLDQHQWIRTIYINFVEIGVDISFRSGTLNKTHICLRKQPENKLYPTYIVNTFFSGIVNFDGLKNQNVNQTY